MAIPGEFDVEAERRRRLRAMSHEEKLEWVGRMMQLAIAARDLRYRRRYPDLTAEECRQRCLEDAIAEVEANWHRQSD